MSIEDKEALEFLIEAQKAIDDAIELVKSGKLRFNRDPKVEGIGYGMLVGGFEISKRKEQ